MARYFVAASTALLLVACSRKTPPGSATPQSSSSSITTSSSASADGADCEHWTTPPPGAELLCDEHVMAQGAELHWVSYATSEAHSDVNRFYRERAHRCGLGSVDDPKSFSITHAPTELSTHDATPVDYPSCEKKPSESARTVILVSTKFDR